MTNRDLGSSQYAIDTLIGGSRTPAWVVRLPQMTLWFSYSTLVAFTHPERGVVCIRNEWGPTTGKHLNAIEGDHKRRVTRAEFEELLAEVKGLMVAGRMRGAP